ncbi:MAG: ComF family protein [Candidatus Schekmanbacteria bacterium]|nr:MAG: ComF family protein [Candidatus Schekmanbacteria bacterium]
MHQFKYKGKTGLGREIIREYLKRYGKNIEDFSPDIVTFIPLHPYREWKRGYNQSYIIAEEISKFLKTKIYTGIRRIKNTKQQVGLNKKERRKNIKGVFALRKKSKECLKYKKILLVDDVFTTGATSEECGNILKKAGARELALFTISRRHL